MLLAGTRHMPGNETQALRYLHLAAEAQNPAGAGLQGYVLLNQFLAQMEELVLAEGLPAARKYCSTAAGMNQVDKFLKLLQFSNRKGDVHGILGMGVAYFHGVGLKANLTRALDHLERTAGSHADAGFYIGEICMGKLPLDLSGNGDASGLAGKHQRTQGKRVETDGEAKGRNAAENQVLKRNAIAHAVQQKEIDTAAATRAYTVSAQLGHSLSQHR
jgi:TPR repeat protein